MENEELLAVFNQQPEPDIFNQEFPVILKEAPIYNPTKFTILTGSDGILDDLFSYQVFNYLKNHWRAAAAPADKQPGMIRSDSDDDKLHHYGNVGGAAWEEILQLTRSSDVSPYFANLYLAQYIYHTGDLDTYIRFQADHMTLRAGGVDFINMVEAATDYLQLLAGKNFIGDNANAKMAQGLTIQQAGYDDEILALKSTDVAHGITDFAETDTFGALAKVSPTTGGVTLRGYGEGVKATQLDAYYTIDDTDKDAGGSAAITFRIYKKSGTGIGNCGANANIVSIKAQVGGALDAKWILDEDGDTWQNGNIKMASATSKITGGAKLSLEAGATGIYSETIHDDTTVATPNVYISAGDHIMRDTSSRRYKDKIKDLELDPSLIYNLLPRSFNSLCEFDDKKKRYHGLIAEEVGKVSPELVDYNEKGEADNYDTKVMMTLILAEVQKHEIEIEALKAQLNN